MFKKVLKIFGIILLVGFVSVFVRGYEYQVSKSKVKDEINIDSTQTPTKDVEENESTIKEETQTSKEEENNSTQQKEDTSITKPSSTPKPSATPKPSTTPKPTETPKPSATQNNNSTSNKEQTTTNSNSNSSVEVKPWERLGISEYDYYNKPAWSWQNIDFVLNGSGENACSSREDCRRKCQEYGDNYLSEHSGSYNCDTVNSYSGNYLGEDFTFVEL